MEKYTPEELIRKYLAGACTEEEKALVESWHISDLAGSAYIPDEEKINAVHERMQTALAAHIQATRPTPRIGPLRFRMVAAAILLLVLAGGYWWKTHQPREHHFAKTPAPSPADIAPGHEGAILTLADGHTLVLDSLGNGTVATQQGTRLVLSAGTLAYHPAAAGTEAIVYNMVHTPRGRHFRLVLPDGTQVWLNAASSLRYPTVFTGPERKVEVNGEAYFEVAKNTSMPFIIKTPTETSVQVLGTAFDINAYSDEPSINTSLLSGSVKVVAGPLPSQRTALLMPGGQAQVTADGNIKVVDHADLGKVMAWKNGVFNFQDAGLKEVMRQLARWYDIDIVYEQGVPDFEFEGEINQGNTLAVVLNSLEKVGVHFRLENGRRLVVQP